MKQICPLLPACAASIGDVQVRNKGTIGGSLAHSDPAGDWPAAAIALHAKLVLVGPNGERTVDADDFFVDLLTTDLQPGEILREIRINKPSGKFGQAYQKVPHPASGFAVVGIAVNLSFKTDGSCESASIGVTGVGVKAYRATASESALVNSNLDDTAIGNAASHVCDGIDPTPTFTPRVNTVCTWRRSTYGVRSRRRKSSGRFTINISVRHQPFRE